jgi:hypothetical protein
MSGLTIEQMIKIGLGFLVVVVVIVGITIFSKNSVINFLKGLPTGNKSAFFAFLLK